MMLQHELDVEGVMMIEGKDRFANRYLLGVDVGTTSIKVAIIDETATLKGMQSASYRLLKPQPGYMEIDTSDMWRAFLDCLCILFTDKAIDPKKVAGIGISCLCPGLAAFDTKGEIIADPIIYSDRRSVEEAEIIKEIVGVNALFDITANTAMSGAISSTSMLWIKRHQPEIYQSTRYFGHVNTLLALKMTGEYAIDRSNASYTGLFETAGNLEWSPKLCEQIGIDITKLPPLKHSDEVVGGLVNQEMIDLGLIASTPVVIGGGDTACASLAAGIVKSNDVCESVGTTNVLTICVDQPRFNPSFINRCHVVSGTWIYQGAMSHTGSSLVWFMNQFCPDLKERADREGISPFVLMDEEAGSSSDGAGGIVFLPYMQGERSPVWDSNARGVFFGLSLQSKRADMIRAVLEGCGYGLRQLIDIAEQTTGQPISEFVSLGGGAKSETWAQIKSDIIGKNINVMEMNDAAPVGAALLAGVGCGLFRNVAEASAKLERKIFKRIVYHDESQSVYKARFRVYTELYPRLKDLFTV